MKVTLDDINMSEYKNELSFKNKLIRFFWNILYWILFRPFSLSIFRLWRIFLLNCFGAKVHYSSLVAASAKIWLPSNLVMKEFSLIAQETDIYNVDMVTIGKNTIVSQKSYLCTASHDIFDKSHPLIHKPIILEDNVWIAADAFVGMGVKIGQGAVVGARSAVFKNVEPWSIVGGNPAKFIKPRKFVDQ